MVASEIEVEPIPYFEIRKRRPSGYQLGLCVRSQFIDGDNLHDRLATRDTSPGLDAEVSSLKENLARYVSESVQQGLPFLHDIFCANQYMVKPSLATGEEMIVLADIDPYFAAPTAKNLIMAVEDIAIIDKVIA